MRVQVGMTEASGLNGGGSHAREGKESCLLGNPITVRVLAPILVGVPVAVFLMEHFLREISCRALRDGCPGPFS